MIKKLILVLLLIIFIIVGILVAKFGNFGSDNNIVATTTATSTSPAVSTTSATHIVTPTTPIACTEEAKQCPDGSYVGRTGPKCEFSVCPSATSSTNKVVQKLCHPGDGETYQVMLCGNLYNVFAPNLMDAPTKYYDIKGIFQGNCAGMPGPSGSSYDDKVCELPVRCSGADLCE